MRFLLLVPGTGHFFCGSCLRDDALGRALRSAGHDAFVAPLYLPLHLETGESTEPVRMGGINMYLQQKLGVARHLPRVLADRLDRPGLLRWAARQGSLTEAPDLGAMTLSMLEGRSGRQAKELEKLVDWARSIEPPDVVVLSNAMLSGVVEHLKEALGCPVVCTLQGEAPFLDALPAPWSERAWSALRERAQAIDAFIPVSHHYGGLMGERLGVESGRVHVVHNGIELGDFAASPPPLAERGPPTIGYLARMCRDKGLPTLVEAYRRLRSRDSVPDLRLDVVGVRLKEDRPLVAELERKLAADGLRMGVHPNVSREEKLAHLHRFRVLSVPALYGESFGLYILEALAAGVPVVQPRHGAFPELLEATGGGVLCEPDDPESLADGIESLLRDAERAQSHADTGRARVHESFGAGKMAASVHKICKNLR